MFVKVHYMSCFNSNNKGTWKEQLKQKFRNGRRGTKITSPDEDDQENQPDLNSDLTIAPTTGGVKKKGRASGGMSVVYKLFIDKIGVYIWQSLSATKVNLQ